MTHTMLSPEVLDRSGGTQPRAHLDETTVQEYADAMAGGDEFPPVVAFYDGDTYWLADGFHRVNAALRINASRIAVEVWQGSLREAILHSVRANATHGMRRTNEDKARAVARLLQDPEWAAWSNREIARRAAVSEFMVRELRNELTAIRSQSENTTTERTYTTRHGTVATMQTANISRATQTEHIGAQPATPARAPAAPQPEDEPDGQPAVEEPDFAPEFTTPTVVHNVTVHCADARLLTMLVARQTVDLVITSPPYNTGGAIEYDGHDDNMTDLEYVKLLSRVWMECYRVMRPGARICVNVPFGMGRQPWRPVAGWVMSGLVGADFELDGQIIWDKNTTGNRTSWGSWRKPTSPVLRDTCEAVIVAHKPGDVALPGGILVSNGDGPDVSPWLDADTFMTLTQDHWVIAPESAQRVGHPAPFPVKLAEGLIRLYGWPGCAILDPFAGSGTTAVAAIGLPMGYRCPVVLIDQSKRYCLRAVDRVLKSPARLPV